MNIVLFINGPLGIRVLDYISEIKACRIIQIFLNSEEKQSKNYAVEVQRLLEKKNLNYQYLHGLEILHRLKIFAPSNAIT